MTSLKQLRDNWTEILVRVSEAAERSGRQASDVSVMAVTKQRSLATVRLAIDAGISLLGENRVQEAETKYSVSEGDSGRIVVGGDRPELHLIGHLQRNKARRAAELFACVQSIDKLATAQALAAGLQTGRLLDVLLEVNTSGEDSKYGYRDPERMLEELALIDGMPGLRVLGLMTIAPFTDLEGPIRASFENLRKLYERARRNHPHMRVLSMGMTSDFEIAIEEGATMIRVGTAVFGASNDA